MNYIKTRKDLVFGLSPLFIFIGILFFCYFSSFIHFYFDAVWLATICTFLLIITPLGNIRLAHNENDFITRLPLSQWLLSIVLFELAMFGVFWGICYATGSALPINTTPHPYLFSESLQTTLLQYGLFPWSLYAVITIGMGVLVYCQQQNAYFSNLLHPFIKTNLENVISLIVNVGSRRVTIFAVGSTLVFLPILIISLTLSPEKHIAYGFQTASLLTTLLLLFSTFSDTIKKYWARLFSRHIPTFLSLPVFCIILAVTIILLSAMFTGITPKNNEATPLFIQNWINYHWQTAWLTFSMTWWLTFTPAICAHLIHISRGYKIRDVVLAIIMLPIIIALLLFFHHDATLSLGETTLKIISLLSFLIALPLLVNYRHLPCLIFSYFPKNGEMKTRDHHPFFQKIIQICIVGLYFYLVIGVNGISIFIFATNYFWLISVLFSCIAIVANTLLA